MSPDYLEHYASPYYDPVKAHEYYMQHRKLKGRQRSALSDEGKEVWDYTKENITEEKKGKIEEAKTERDQQIEELRSRADETRERITQKLKELNERLLKHAKARQEDIAEQRQRQIDAANVTILKNASPKKKARLIAERKAKIAQIRKDAQTESNSIREDTKAEQDQNRQTASAERKQASVELKGAIAAAREAYAQKKAGIDASYEEIFQQEFDKIAAEFPKKSKAKKSGKKSSKKSSKKTTKKKEKTADVSPVHQMRSKEERHRLVREYRKKKKG